VYKSLIVASIINTHTAGRCETQIRGYAQIAGDTGIRHNPAGISPDFLGLSTNRSADAGIGLLR